MAAPRQRSGTIERDVPGTGECVVLDKEEGRILALNPTGAAIWDLLDGRRGISELAAILTSASGITRREAEQDVRAFLKRLGEEGFLANE